MTRSGLWRLALLPLALLPSGRAASPVADVTGLVFLDRDGNGLRDAGEPGVPNVVVSDQVQVVRTGTDGRFRISGSTGFGVVFVSVPSGYRAVGKFWRDVQFGPPDPVEFALEPGPAPVEWSFIHASDTHISDAALPRTQLLRGLADSIQPAFVLITGDLIRDALRVPEAEATAYYALFEQEAAQFRMPLWTVPGNHELFGIERHQSLVSPRHPLYARGMYRRYRGPDYYSFTYGGVHFVGLNSVDIDDLWYYGHVDSVQVAWLQRDLATVSADMPVVTFNHIPFFTAGDAMYGYRDESPAPTTIRVGGRTIFRHVVSNARDVLEALRGRPYPLALAGHLHMRESLEYAGVATRFHQAAAVVGPSNGSGLLLKSGVTVYRVSAGKLDAGRFVPLDP